MAIYLSGTTDHALLALAVEEASKVAAQSNAYVGRTALMKLMYFLREEGAPLSYRFEMYHYGPFCQRVLRDVDWMKADKVIHDSSKTPGTYSDYEPGPELDELFGQHGALVEEWRPKVARVAEKLIPLDAGQLEVLATLDYLHRQQKAINSPAPLRERVLEQFARYKGEKYELEGIAKFYDEVFLQVFC